MLIVIRNGEKISAKTKFILDLYKDFNKEAFYALKQENGKLGEKWLKNKVHLSSSKKGMILYYMLMLVKDPKDIRNGLMARLSLRKRMNLLTEEGLLSTLSRTFSLYFGSSGQINNFMNYLGTINCSKTFLIDEFVSLRCLDLKKLKTMGSLIYVSQDIAYKRFGFGDNSITRQLMVKFEKEPLANFDLVVACSELERFTYLQMGAKKVIYYPNFYPTKKFKLDRKDDTPSISIVLRPHWGSVAECSLNKIFNVLTRLNCEITVYMFGIKPKTIPKNAKLNYFDFLPNKTDYLQVLSRSWIGINVGIHKGGTNERKYDYAEAGLVVVSDSFGSRGDLLPHEYSYVDSQDLEKKMTDLIKIGKQRLKKMGEENRKMSLMLAESQRMKLLNVVKKFTQLENPDVA